MTVPYENATSGDRARGEIRKLQQRFGCESVGFMERICRGDAADGVPLPRSPGAAADLGPRVGRAVPAREPVEHPEAVHQGRVGDAGAGAGDGGGELDPAGWVRGQITAVETGITEFRHVFLPYMVTASGETVAELVDRRGNQVLELPE